MRQSTRPARFGLLLIVTAAGLLVAACAARGRGQPREHRRRGSDPG